MAEDLQENLSTYQLQLQQVEAALTNDPQNEDLLKLQNDLQEVINLTLELVNQNTQPKTGEAGDASSSQTTSQQAPSSTIPLSTSSDTTSSGAVTSDWKVGDDCLAVWSDGQYYPAIIEEILENGSCTVTFQSYGDSDLTQISLLKKVEKTLNGDGASSSLPKSKKDQIAQQREYKRKKQQKKAQRLKQLEEEREKEKNKWVNFNSKTFSKTTKGKVKKSIFATTDTVQGRVGVGTCGVSGRPMTSYQHQEKWRKS